MTTVHTSQAMAALLKQRERLEERITKLESLPDEPFMSAKDYAAGQAPVVSWTMRFKPGMNRGARVNYSFVAIAFPLPYSPNLWSVSSAYGPQQKDWGALMTWIVEFAIEMPTIWLVTDKGWEAIN